MNLTAQGPTDLKNLMAKTGVKNNISTGKQPDSIFQHGDIDQQSFLNVISNFIRQKEISSRLPNEKCELSDHKEQLKNELFNLFMSNFESANTSQTSMTDLLTADSFGLVSTVSGQPDFQNFIDQFLLILNDVRTPFFQQIAKDNENPGEEFKHVGIEIAGPEENYLEDSGAFWEKLISESDNNRIQAVLKHVFDSITMSKSIQHQVSDINNSSIKGNFENEGDLEPGSGFLKNPISENFIKELSMIVKDIGKSAHLVTGNRSDLQVEGLEHHSIETEKNNSQHLSLLLKKILSSEFNSEKHPLIKQPSEDTIMLKLIQGRTETTAHNFETNRQVFQTFEEGMRSSKEPLAEEDLRQILNGSTRESNKQSGEEDVRTNTGFNRVTDIKLKMQKAGPIPNNIKADHSDGNFQNPKQSWHFSSTIGSQTHSALNAPEITNDGNFRMNQIGTTLFRDPMHIETGIVNQIIGRLFNGIRQGTGNMTIYLYPPELGKVKVRIVSEKNGMNIHLQHGNQQVVEILAKYLPVLQNSLEDQDVTLSNLQVSVELEDRQESQTEERNLWLTDGNFNSIQPSREDPENTVSKNYSGRTGPAQGLSLRV